LIEPPLYLLDSRSANIANKMDVACTPTATNICAAPAVVGYFHGVIYILYAFPDGCSTGCKSWKIVHNIWPHSAASHNGKSVIITKDYALPDSLLALIALIFLALH